MRALPLLAGLALTGLGAATSADWTVYLKRLGPVEYGMTVAEANRLPGVRLEVPTGFNDYAPCGWAFPQDTTTGLAFMTDGDRIVRGDVTRLGVRTASGVGVGSTAADVRRAYGQKVWEQPHLYGRGATDLLMMYDPYEPGDEAYRVVFNVFDDTVRSLSSGLLPHVMAPEGCI